MVVTMVTVASQRLLLLRLRHHGGGDADHVGHVAHTMVATTLLFMNMAMWATWAMATPVDYPADNPRARSLKQMMSGTAEADLMVLVKSGVFAAGQAAFRGGLEERLPMAPLATMGACRLRACIWAAPDIERSRP